VNSDSLGSPGGSNTLYDAILTSSQVPKASYLYNILRFRTLPTSHIPSLVSFLLSAVSQITAKLAPPFAFPCLLYSIQIPGLLDTYHTLPAISLSIGSTSTQITPRFRTFDLVPSLIQIGQLLQVTMPPAKQVQPSKKV
jgi:hypothetical protein